MFEINKVRLPHQHYRKDNDQGQWDKEVGGDASETGSGPGPYDIRQSVWHVNVSLPPKTSHSST